MEQMNPFDFVGVSGSLESRLTSSLCRFVYRKVLKYTIKPVGNSLILSASSGRRKKLLLHHELRHETPGKYWEVPLFDYIDSILDRADNLSHRSSNLVNEP